MNERDDDLLFLALQVKTLHLTLATVVNEVSALRETAKALDPTFSETLDRLRVEAARVNESTIRNRIAECDELIRRLESR